MGGFEKGLGGQAGVSWKSEVQGAAQVMEDPAENYLGHISCFNTDWKVRDLNMDASI